MLARVKLYGKAVVKNENAVGHTVGVYADRNGAVAGAVHRYRVVEGLGTDAIRLEEDPLLGQLRVIVSDRRAESIRQRDGGLGIIHSLQLRPTAQGGEKLLTGDTHTVGLVLVQDTISISAQRTAVIKFQSIKGKPRVTRLGRDGKGNARQDTQHHHQAQSNRKEALGSSQNVHVVSSSINRK